MRKIGIIGGTGIYSPAALKGFKEVVVSTPYGNALCNIGTMFDNKVVFITRHGTGHTVPSHLVNYRANIWALKSKGVEEIFATTAVGSLNKNMTAGHFVVCDQLLDFTKSRINTFYDKAIIASLIVLPLPCTLVHAPVGKRTPQSGVAIQLSWKSVSIRKLHNAIIVVPAFSSSFFTSPSHILC